MILGLCGAGGMGRRILELARQIQSVSDRWEEIIFILDKDYMSSADELVNGVAVYSFDDIYQKYAPSEIEFSITVGETEYRKDMADNITGKGYSLATLIHPSVHIPESTQILDGVTILDFVVISPNVVIGKNTMVQQLLCIGHDCVIGENCDIASNVAIAGNCHIGNNVYIGMSASIIEKTTVGDDSVIGMGSVVLRDVPSNVIVMGNPARVIKKKNDGQVFK